MQVRADEDLSMHADTHHDHGISTGRSALSLLATLTEVGVRVTAAMSRAFPDGCAMTNQSIQLLLQLHASGPRRPSHLADQLHASRSQISKTLNDLEDAHLITRRRGHNGDRRAITVDITPTGCAVLHAAEHTLQTGFDDLESVQQLFEEFLVRTAPASDPEH